MSILNIPDAVRRILAAVDAGDRGYICVTGMHGIMEARDDWKLQKILNDAFLCTPDGMPTVWLGKARGHHRMDRVYGPDLMLAVQEATRTLPVRHFFYGGAEGVAEDLRGKMEKRFPGLRISGTYCPPFRSLTEAEREELRTRVVEAEADVFWVGLSTPKQERFMAEFLPLLPAKVMLGVGAAFDFHTGRARQAPRWMQRAGLEWFFRLITEPRRLWKRYLIQVPRFAALVAMDRFGLVSHSSEFHEMPRAFGLAGLSVPVFLFSASAILILCLVSLFSIGWAPALHLAGLCGIALASFTAATGILHAFSAEERLDRIAPLAALLLFLVTGIAAFSLPVASLVAELFFSREAAFAIARSCAMLTAGTAAVFVAVLSSVALGVRIVSAD